MKSYIHDMRCCILLDSMKCSFTEHILWNASYTVKCYCNTLQHTATHCNTLQHTAMTLQHTATHCNTLQHILWNAPYSVERVIYNVKFLVRICETLNDIRCYILLDSMRCFIYCEILDRMWNASDHVEFFRVIYNVSLSYNRHMLCCTYCKIL